MVFKYYIVIDRIILKFWPILLKCQGQYRTITKTKNKNSKCLYGAYNVSGTVLGAFYVLTPSNSPTVLGCHYICNPNERNLRQEVFRWITRDHTANKH